MTVQTAPDRKLATFEDVAEAIGELSTSLRWMENALKRGNDIAEAVHEAQISLKWIDQALRGIWSQVQAVYQVATESVIAEQVREGFLTTGPVEPSDAEVRRAFLMAYPTLRV